MKSARPRCGSFSLPYRAGVKIPLKVLPSKGTELITPDPNIIFPPINHFAKNVTYEKNADSHPNPYTNLPNSITL